LKGAKLAVTRVSRSRSTAGARMIREPTERTAHRRVRRRPPSA
jgi:hypothetical protein